MIRIFFNVLFVLVLLFSGFFTLHNVEAKSKVKLSKRYIPTGNPGGTNFYADEDFAESYRLYEKRREIMRKKRLQGRSIANENREYLVKELKEKKIASLNDETNNIGTYIVFEDAEEDAMINQHGINLARLKGAMFIDQELIYQYGSGEDKGGPQKVEKITSAQEEKVSHTNVFTKKSPPGRVCHNNFTADLNGTAHYSLSGSGFFVGMLDTVNLK